MDDTLAQKEFRRIGIRKRAGAVRSGAGMEEEVT
jgi:hypothetical protein